MPTPSWPEDLTPIDREATNDEYLQCAGSADALSCEIRKLVDGVPQLFTIGRQETRTQESSIRIPFANGKHQLTVFSNEVFAANEAAAIFLTYLNTNDIPDGYILRKFDLETPL